MRLDEFRAIVDSVPAGIQSCSGDLAQQYSYVGLKSNGSYQRQAVKDALRAQVRAAFGSGHGLAWEICRTLKTDLIREHIIRGVPIDPYFEVLSHLQDPLRVQSKDRSEIKGDWSVAVRAAQDHIEISDWRTSGNQNAHSRDYSVARAARALQDQGYAIRLEPGWISLEESAEKALVKEIERLIATIGGLNLLRRIFAAISHLYDAGLQRYHLIPRVSMMGEGQPQVPWGYLLQLAVKHMEGRKPYVDSDENWSRLILLAMRYAAVIDVQLYYPTAFGGFHPEGLLMHLRETALYDTMFRVPQLRPSDVVRLSKGLLAFLDLNQTTPDGWSVQQALDIVAALFDRTPDTRGPVFVSDADIRKTLGHIPGAVVTHVLEHVLSHPASGANQKFSRPIDVPTAEDPSIGLNFQFRPLLRFPGLRFLMVDRSVCALACLEALLAALRLIDRDLDNKVGLEAERYLKAKLAAHGVSAGSGDYDVGPDHGECDLVVEADKTIVFLEIKKKSLTRLARAGGDAQLLLDLTGSLLDAQAQAGWHEVRLRKAGSLELKHDKKSYPLERNNREIERIAVALLDYGSFQDRIFLRDMLETYLNASFSSSDPKINQKLMAINNVLQEFRDQIALLHPGEAEVNQPFFHCWFLSLPQLLIMLDDVSDPATFWAALQKTRHIITGSSDFYYDYSLRKQWATKGAAQRT